MHSVPDQNLNTTIEALYRAESGRVLASLIRLLGDFTLAEEAMQNAFATALSQWPEQGIPDQPRAWLVSVGRFQAIDQHRASQRHQRLLQATPVMPVGERSPPEQLEQLSVPDDLLRLIFTCCHPALAEDARIALTLREVCGLSTEEIARAFLARPTTIAQRIVRAKRKIQAAGIPYEVPGPAQLGERLPAVLQVIYLVFNEGYAASRGEALLRVDLCHEAIRLARSLIELLPDGESEGLLALMLLQNSRRHARIDAQGQLLRLEEQDRSLWDRAMIEEGCRRVQQVLARRRVGPYTVQAAIAAVHAQAARYEDTDWAEILGLYDILMRLSPSPVVALNRAVALGQVQGAEAALAAVEAAMQNPALENFHLAHAARAEFCLQLGRLESARASFQRALALTEQGAEQQHLGRRLAVVSAALDDSEPLAAGTEQSARR